MTTPRFGTLHALGPSRRHSTHQQRTRWGRTERSTAHHEDQGSSPPVEPNRQRSRHRPVSFGEFEVHQRTFNALSKLSTISLYPIATGKYQKRQGRCRYTSFSHPDAVIRRRVSALSQLSDRHAKCFIDLPAWFGTPAPRTPHHDRVVHNAKRAVFKIHYQAAA